MTREESMITVNLIISSKLQSADLKDVQFECNLLKREDANEVEWQIAKAFEKIVEFSIDAIAIEIYSVERVDGEATSK